MSHEARGAVGAEPAATGAVSREADGIRGMFAGIAHRYDLLNRLLSAGRDRYWRREAVASACLPPGGFALDVCTGTADVAIELARQFPAARAIVGVDFCLPMLRLGGDKVARAGLAHRISLHAASAEALPFDDAMFDAATVAFGIRNVVDRMRGLAELGRVIRPGGRVVILEFATPEGPVFGRLYRFYFRHMLPRLGGIISGSLDAYSYLPASVAAFPSPGELADMIERVGFCDVRCRTMTGGIVTLHVGNKPG
jgi:demethylmenaquinone methyltransferase/2-methoxy-6-polyprenyl-1,4-benzoquinol methylase